VGKKPITVTTASTEHSYWLALFMRLLREIFNRNASLSVNYSTMEWPKYLNRALSHQLSVNEATQHTMNE